MVALVKIFYCLTKCKETLVLLKKFRFGVGKKGMENICLEELQYLNEEIQKNRTSFNISVSFTARFIIKSIEPVRLHF